MNYVLRVLATSAAMAGALVHAQQPPKDGSLAAALEEDSKANAPLGSYQDPTLDAIAAQRAEVARLFAAKDFAGLDKLADAARTSKERFANGGWKLYAFYGALDIPRQAPDRHWLEQLEIHKQWTSAAPKSPAAHIALADFYISYGWRARGGGFADTVKEESWRVFSERLQTASEILDRCGNFAESDPHYWRITQTLALGMEWPNARKTDLFKRAIGVEPQYWSFYLARANALMPRWDGEEGEMEEFAAAAVEIPGGPGPEIYARIVDYMDTFHTHVFRETKFDWSKCKLGIEDLLKKYPNQPSLISLGAKLAVRQGDADYARALFKQLGNRVDLRTWKSVDHYLRHARHVNAPIPE